MLYYGGGGQPVTRRSDKEQVPKQLDRELPIYVEGGKKILKKGMRSNTLPEGTNPSESSSSWQPK